MSAKSSLLNDASYWRSRAEAMRSVAKVLRRENSQAIALRIADDYDRLAEQAEAEAANILQWPAPKT